MLNGQKLNHIMTAGTNDYDQDSTVALKMEALLKSGLLANHCYSVLELFEGPGGIKLLRLRNPHGHQEWNGDWSDSSPKWNGCAFANKLDHQVANDGIFWISFQDYMKHFVFTNICKYNDDDIHSSVIKTQPVPQQTVFEFELAQGAPGFNILVNQMGDRLKRRKRNDGT